MGYYCLKLKRSAGWFIKKTKKIKKLAGDFFISLFLVLSI